MENDIGRVFQASPAIVRTHFTFRYEQLRERIQDFPIQLHFRSGVSRFGPGSIQAVLKNDTYDLFSEEARAIMSSCFYFSSVFVIRSFVDVDEMFMRIEALVAGLQPLFPRNQPTEEEF